MNRITVKFLEAQVLRLNRATGSPEAQYVKNGDKYEGQIGNYHLSGAYGGYALHRMMNDGGGITDIFGGHMPKRELSERIHSFLSGIEAGREMFRPDLPKVINSNGEVA